MQLIQILTLFIKCNLGQLSFVRFKEIQHYVGVIPYTGEQRMQVANSVKNMISIYVNRQSKLDNYAKELGCIDPVPRIAKLVDRAFVMNDLLFHYEMIDIFMALRDFHTTYELPGPHRCVENYKAVSFEVIGTGNNQRVVVDGFYDDRILNLSSAAKAIRIGDELLSISGNRMSNLLRISGFTTGGANDAGSLRAALKSFSTISGKYNRLPSASNERYKFQRPNGTVYVVILPWISAIDSQCWIESKSFMRPSGFFVLPKPVKEKTKKRKQDLMSLEDSDSIKSIKLNSDIGFQITNSCIKWILYESDSKTMGIIKITSFQPEFLNVQYFIHTFRQLLLTVLKDTDAILIDVRSNTGGMIQVADMIAQLFGMTVKTGSYRVTTSPINKLIFTDKSEGRYTFDQDIDPFSSPVKITTNEEANNLGQVYLKPVGVFTNGKCYSACEVFAANMRDNNIATIFGEDYTTGGGGAINADYAFLSERVPLYFPPIPFSTQLSKGAQNFSVAWKQFVRINGDLIEDTGVRSEYIVRPVIEDLTRSLKLSSQYKQISKILFQEEELSLKAKLKIEIFPQIFNTDWEIRTDFKFEFQTFGFKNILVFDQTGKLIQTTSSSNSTELYDSKFVLPSARQTLSIQIFNIQGYNFQDKLSFSTWRQIRFVPNLKTYMQIDGPTKIQFTSILNYMGIYNYSKNKAGWVNSNDNLTVKSSAGDVKSIVSYFFDLSPHTILVSIQGSYRTAGVSDFFNIGYTKDSLSDILFDTKSINLKTDVTTTFDHIYLVPSGKVELFFEFKSGGLNDAEVTINSIDFI